MTTSPWKEKPSPNFQIWCPVEFDLAGAAATFPIIAPKAFPLMWGNRDSETFSLLVKEILIAYTLGTTGTHTNHLRIGSTASPTLNHTYTIPASKSIGDLDQIDQSVFTGDPRIVGTTNTLQVSILGTTGGTGKFYVGVLVSQRADEWFSFDPQATP